MTTGPTDAPVPSGTSRDIYTLGRRLDEIIRRLDLLETQRGFVIDQVRAHVPNRTAFGSTWVEALVSLVDVPRGFSQCQIFIGVSAGMTGIGSGNIGVWPRINDLFTPETPLSNSNGGEGAATVSTFDSQLVTGLAAGSTLKLAAWCYNTGTLAPADSANVHLSASLLFLR